MKNLVIVESPAKAKTIEKILGKDYTVLSSNGHIRDLKKHGLSVDVEKNFHPQYEIPADKKDVAKKLRQAAKDAEEVWLASDEDREGEAIAWHLAQVLGLDAATAKRIVFHEITEPAIRNAIANPRTIDLHRVNAQQARRVLDRIVGFELSPVLWKKIRPSLSAGRVQSVALRLICEREQEINDFKPESFYRVNALFKKENGETFKGEYPARIDSKSKAKEFLENCIDCKFNVSNINVKPHTRSPYPPFTTSTLQQEASRKLGYSVTLTMSIAQKLYEAGKITYMRTDSTNLSDLAINSIKKTVTQDFGPEYLKVRHYHTHSKGAQEAHEAIRPTYISNKTIEGTLQEQRLYELIWKRAVASQMADAEIEKTTVDINGVSDSTTEPLKFRAEGEVVNFPGFLKVWKSENSRKQEFVELPVLSVGEAIGYKEITATQRFTQAPPRYTDGALVDKMEELGIGRPATYGQIISTILHRDYVKKGEKEGTKRDYEVMTLKKSSITSTEQSEMTGSDKGKLVPTDVGLVVNRFLTEYFPDILDYNFTAKVEEKFDDIAQGRLEWQKEISDFYGDFHPDIERLNTLRMDHKVGERVLGHHPETGRPVSVKIGRYGPIVQIGEATDSEKPLFAGLQPGQSIDNLTLEDALKLFELPRTVGLYEGKPVIGAIGRFGPYIKHDSLFVSIPSTMSPQSITLEEAIQLIDSKRETEANKLIKEFSELPGVEILNGRYGPYIAYKEAGTKKAKNYKIPKGKVAAELTAEEVKEIMQEQNTAPKRGGRRSSK